MGREMKNVSVFVNQAGNVSIEQKGGVSDQPDLIVLTPDQVDLVIEWLHEAKEEALTQRSQRPD